MRRIMGVWVLSVSILSVAVADSSTSEQQKAPPAVAAAPAGLDFGNQVIKRASKSKRITLTNTGEEKLYINSVAIDGDNGEDFTLVHDTCTGATIDSRKSCVVDVSFTPAQTGSRKGALAITDNATDSPQRLILSGSGINSVDVPPTRPPE